MRAVEPSLEDAGAVRSAPVREYYIMQKRAQAQQASRSTAKQLCRLAHDAVAARIVAILPRRALRTRRNQFYLSDLSDLCGDSLGARRRHVPGKATFDALVD